MTRILYTAFLFLNILLFLVSCKNTNHLEDGTLPAVTQIEELEIKDSSKVETDGIVGIYKSEKINADDQACEVSIEVSGSRGNYKYFLQSKRQDINGVLLVENSDVAGELNLMMQGLKYDMYEGDKSTGKASATAPTQVPAVLNGNSIMIENRGSDANTFTVFNDCDGISIKLQKQKDL